MPATILDATPNTVYAVKTADRDGYVAIQLGFGMKKNATKAEIGHAKGANKEKAPSFLREIRLETADGMEIGGTVKAAEVFEVGDIVDVQGFSKGKGFAGVVKRFHFRGGPRTHGQSDRERAPGSIGAGTTPGRVYKNKRMAGKKGNDFVTIKNLIVLAVSENEMVVSGLIPGKLTGMVTVLSTGKKMKKLADVIDPLIELPKEEVVETPVEEMVEEAPVVAETPSEEVQAETEKENAETEGFVAAEMSEEPIENVEDLKKEEPAAEEEAPVAEEVKPADVENSGEAKEEEK